MRESTHVPLAELKRIVDHWAESALQLREQDLKVMQRLANAQSKLATATG
jgi:DSF synthase